MIFVETDFTETLNYEKQIKMKAADAEQIKMLLKTQFLFIVCWLHPTREKTKEKIDFLKNSVHLRGL